MQTVSEMSMQIVSVPNKMKITRNRIRPLNLQEVSKTHPLRVSSVVSLIARHEVLGLLPQRLLHSRSEVLELRSGQHLENHMVRGYHMHLRHL